MKSVQPRTDEAPPDDDPRAPPGPNASATDPTAPTTTETEPMLRTARPSRNAEVDFRGQRPTNATHGSITDPDARLYRKSPSTGATLCFIGHALMDMRHVPPPVRGTCRLRSDLIVQGDLTRADGRAERRGDRHDPSSLPGIGPEADASASMPLASSLTCARPASPPMSRRDHDIRRQTGEPPDTTAMPNPSVIANASKRLSAGPRPSEAWPRRSIAASKRCDPASS